jgi:hypothetical protein
VRRALPLAALLMAACLACGAREQKCAATEATIVGSWEGVKGSFEEMAFEREDGKRIFNSWLHQRPEYIGGEWTLDKCWLAIRIESAGASFDYAWVRRSGSRLYLRKQGEGAEEVYKRIK